MPEDFAESFISAFAVGRQLAQRKQQMAAEEEDRKLRLQILKHQMDREKIEGQLKQKAILQQEDLMRAQVMQGKPGKPMFNTFPGAMIQQPHPTVNVRSQVEGEPPIPVQPETQQQVQQQQLRDFLLKSRMAAAQTAMTEEAKLPYELQKAEALAGIKGQETQQQREWQAQQNELNRQSRIKAAGTSGKAMGDALKQQQAKEIADEIESGRQSPELTRLFGLAGPVRAELGKRDFNLTAAELDWKAMTKYMSTLNGDRQLRLRQSINFANEHLGIIEDLYNQWLKTGLPGGYKDYNRAALVAATHLPGQSGAIAQSLLANLNDFTSEMGTVYKGGNSSTDETLRLAAENLKGEWNQATFRKQVEILRKTLKIRTNSVNLGPLGMSGTTNYMGGRMGQGEAAAPAGGTEEVWERGPDGKLRRVNAP